LRRLSVALREVIPPRGRPPEPVVHGRAQVVDLMAPERQPGRSLDRLQPDAAHLRLDLAVAVRAHAPAGTVAQLLRAVHRTGHPGRVEDALAAHVTAPDGLLDGVLDRGQRPARPGHQTATAERLRSIRSFASLTA